MLFSCDAGPAEPLELGGGINSLILGQLTFEVITHS